MKGRALSFLLVALFALALGHLAWGALAGPPMIPDYLVGGDAPALSGADPEARQLYLRRELYLSQHPRYAWISVVGRDRLHLYVNGTLVGSASGDGFNVAVVEDIAPYLNPGRNIIAILANQGSLRNTPLVAVEGGCTLSDGEHRFGADKNWRCQNVLERRGNWWFETSFHDRHWPAAHLSQAHLRAKLTGGGSGITPPRAMTVPGTGRWITPLDLNGKEGVVRREFAVSHRPRQAWLRVVTTASYALAINGHFLDREEATLDTEAVPVTPMRRLYDLTPFIQRGHNALALSLTTPTGPPRVQADLEVEDEAGNRLGLGSNEEWLGSAGLPADWLQPQVNAAAWAPCAVSPGDLDILPWLPARLFVPIAVPFDLALTWLAGEVGLILAFALVTLLGCLVAERLFRSPQRGVIYLALLPATLGTGAAMLATLDPRIAVQDVYQVRWLVLAAISVPVQWGLLALCRL
jgi:hypothetical protein